MRWPVAERKRSLRVIANSQGWAQGSFVEAEAEVKAERSRQRRGKAEAESSSLEARQTKFEARPKRGDPLKITFPLDV